MRLQSLKEVKEFLTKEIEAFQDFKENDIYSKRENGILKISLPYAYEKTINISEEEFIEAVNKFRNHELNEDRSIVKTSNSTYYLIDHFFLDRIPNVSFQNDEFSIIIEQNENVLLFGLIALKIGSYHHSYSSPLQIRSSIQINYHDEARLSSSEEKDLIQSFRFELLSKFGFSTEYASFRDSTFFEQLETLDNVEDDLVDASNFLDEIGFRDESIYLNDVIKYDEGSKMFLTANSIDDEEFKFLSLYKIIEYYAPIALRIDAYESLYDKLDSNRRIKPSREYIESIFELVQSYELRRKDKELIKNVFRKSIDIVDIYHKIPQYLKLQINREGISYKDKTSDIDKISSTIAQALYSTRNQLAHAKSNYELTGLECPQNEIEDFNNFLVEAANKVIRWYARLPEFQK